QPSLPYALYVRGVDDLNVFNARSAIVLVVSLFRVLIAIQRHSNAVIADGVREKLQTAFVQLCDRSVVVGGLPKGLALQGRIVAIGVEHGRGVRLHDAV